MARHHTEWDAAICVLLDEVQVEDPNSPSQWNSLHEASTDLVARTMGRWAHTVAADREQVGSIGVVWVDH